MQTTAPDYDEIHLVTLRAFWYFLLDGCTAKIPPYCTSRVQPTPTPSPI
jgi:hypothetical protein